MGADIDDSIVSDECVKHCFMERYMSKPIVKKNISFLSRSQMEVEHKNTIIITNTSENATVAQTPFDLSYLFLQSSLLSLYLSARQMK